MKHPGLKFFIPISFLICSITVAAQKENLDDIVPYRKGKLWGLVHHDMKEFYKPVFDSIILHPVYDGQFDVFNTNRDDMPRAAHVIYKGKMMWLTPDKKLIPYKAEASEKENNEDQLMSIGIINQEGIKDEGDGGEEGTVVANFFTAKTYGNRVIVTKTKSGYAFSIHDTLLAEFNCDYFARINEDEYTPLVILTKGGKKAVGDLAQRKLIVPFGYSYIESPYESGLIIVRNEKMLYGIMNSKGEVMMPCEYTSIEYITHSFSQPKLLIASKGKGDFFIAVRNGTVRQSTVTYSKLAFAGSTPLISFTAIQSGKVGMVTEEDKVLVPFKYDEIEGTYADGIFTLISKGKKGFTDIRNGVFIKEPVFDFITSPLETKFQKNDKYYYVFLVKRNKQAFYIDNFGKEFIAP